MITVSGTLIASRDCPQCLLRLEKTDPDKDVKCVCGFVWSNAKIVQISAGIQGSTKL